MDRNILCNCDREAESNLLLESLAACNEHEDEKPDLEMYFTVKVTFANYLDQLDETIDIPIERNWTHQMHVLPISIEPSHMKQNLFLAPKTLKEYIYQYQQNRKSLDIKEKMIKELTFNTFLSSYMIDVILFATGILTVILTIVIMYMLCGQSKLKTIVANLALQCIKTVEAAMIKETNSGSLELIQLLIILNLVLTASLVLVKLKKCKVFQGHLFTNMVKIKLFLANTQSYVPLELKSAAGNVHLFKLSGALAVENFTLQKNWIWDVLEINWDSTHVTLNDREINLPVTLTIPFVYKLKVRKLFMERKSMHVEAQKIMVQPRKQTGLN